MEQLHTDHVVMSLLRNAANHVRTAGAGNERPLTGRDRALRDVLSQACRHLAAVDIEVEVREHGHVDLHARHGQRGVVVHLRERADGLFVDSPAGAPAVAIRWNPRTYQWEGRGSPDDRTPEPAWYTLAKQVVMALGSHHGPA